MDRSNMSGTQLQGGGINPSPSYEPILANNTWAQIDQASREGKAKELWNLGDEKDGYAIVGFNHDDLADGSGKAGITFAIKNADESGKWDLYEQEKMVYYKKSLYPSRLSGIYDAQETELKSLIKEVTKECSIGTDESVTGVEKFNCKLFLFSLQEIGKGTYGLKKEGETYDNFPINSNGMYATRTVGWTSSGTYFTVSQNGTVYTQSTSYSSRIRYGFCIQEPNE